MARGSPGRSSGQELEWGSFPEPGSLCSWLSPRGLCVDATVWLARSTPVSRRTSILQPPVLMKLPLCLGHTEERTHSRG